MGVHRSSQDRGPPGNMEEVYGIKVAVQGLRGRLMIVPYWTNVAVRYPPCP